MNVINVCDVNRLQSILAIKTRRQDRLFVEFIDSLDFIHMSNCIQVLNTIAVEVIRAGCLNLFALLVENYGYKPSCSDCLSTACYEGQVEIASYLLEGGIRSRCEHLTYVILGARRLNGSPTPIDRTVELIRLLKTHGAPIHDSFTFPQPIDVAQMLGNRRVLIALASR